jgi:hypothetical protein
MNLRRNHFWLGGNVDQDLLSRFPKGTRVWLGGNERSQGNMELNNGGRESEEYELLFRANVFLGEEEGCL